MIDVRSTFRHVGVDSAGAAVFAYYVVASYIVVDMRLQFRRRGSPGWWGIVASAMQDVQRKTAHKTVVISDAGARATSHEKK